VWTNDNQSTAATFFLVYNPKGRATPRAAASAGGQQIGFYNADGSVNSASSPAANAVNLLVQTVVLNYMALHGTEGQFATLFPTNGLGSATLQDGLMSFAPIVNGVIGG
jgi:hypothetical protein